MIPINKEELIKQYTDYKIASYKVGFEDHFKLDRVEKILDCHGWLQEAEEAFKEVEEAIKERKNSLKSKIIEVFKNCDSFTSFEIEKRIEPLKEEIRSADRTGYTRISATEELFKQKKINFIERALILMKLGEVGM